MAKSDETEEWLYARAAKAEATGAWAARRRLAAAMREVIELLSSTDPSEDELARAAAGAEHFAASLRGLPRRSKLEGYAEAATSGDVDAVFDASPLIGLSNPLAPPIKLWREGERVVGTTRFGTAYEGPPGCVHGGFVAAAFDEVLGYAQSLTRNPGMTGTLTIRYLAPSPLWRELRFEAWVEWTEGRKIFAIGKLYADSLLTAEAQGIFISIEPERFRALVAEAMAKKSS